MGTLLTTAFFASGASALIFETLWFRQAGLAFGSSIWASSLVLSERAVEKHSNSIFSKLGLSEEKDVNRRVKAVLLYLSDRT